MKTQKKLLYAILSLLLCNSLNVSSQEYGFGNFISGGINDGQKLIEAYTMPYAKAVGTSMTGGWYNTAEAHKLGGFHITIIANAAIVPSKFETFDVNDLGLTELSLSNPVNHIAPTIAGPNIDGPEVFFNEVPAQSYNTPSGNDFRLIPLPTVQLGVGLVKKTEIMGRFVPRIGISDFSIGMWGIGIKHDIKQYIPVFDKLPILNISVLMAYSRLKAEYEFSDPVTPGTIGLETYNSTTEAQNATWEDQTVEFKESAFTMNLIGSVDLPVIAFYGGFGFNVVKPFAGVNGEYPILETDGTGDPIVDVITDPVELKYKSDEDKYFKPRANIGVRFKFAVITLQFEYVVSQYSMATAGLGVRVR